MKVKERSPGLTAGGDGCRGLEIKGESVRFRSERVRTEHGPGPQWAGRRRTSAVRLLSAKRTERREESPRGPPRGASNS